MNYTITIKDATTAKIQLELVITDNETGRARGDLRSPDQLLEWLMARANEIEAMRKVEYGWGQGKPEFSVPPLTPAPQPNPCPPSGGRQWLKPIPEGPDSCK